MYTLHIANKNYSSWSLRPWVLMKALEIPFTEIVHPFGEQDFKIFSPTATVPCLHDGDIVLWDSLAITEYLAETYKQVWPIDKAARAWARSATSEMHSGFTGIRNTCSMTCGQRVSLPKINEALQKDLDRLNSLWSEGIKQFGGPFLAGKKFSAVDAFFAPVAFRIQAYGLPISAISKTYVETMLALSAMQEWYADALREPWREQAHEDWISQAGEVTKDYRS
ncbi:glutathione S-transferase family protein [Aurantivibrio infirmus]